MKTFRNVSGCLVLILVLFSCTEVFSADLDTLLQQQAAGEKPANSPGTKEKKADVKTTKANAEKINALFDQVQQQLDAGKVADAMALLDRILKLDPLNGDAWTIEGNIHLLKKEVRDAEACYQKAIDSDIGRADFYNNMAVLKLKKGDAMAAVTLFDLAQKLDPSNAVTLYNLGNIALIQGRADEAEQYYDSVIEAHPDYAPAHYKKGAMLLGRGELAGAIEQYETAVRADPALADARTDLGMAYFQAGRLDDAAAQLQIVVKQQPAFARAHYDLGIVLKGQEKYADAMAELTRALELNPHNADYELDLAFATLYAGGKNPAVKCEQMLLQILRENPDHPRANYLAGVFYDETSRPEKAIQYYRQAIMLGFPQPRAKLYLAESFIKTGQKPLAEPLLRELSTALPEGDEIREQAQKLLQSL